MSKLQRKFLFGLFFLMIVVFADLRVTSGQEIAGNVFPLEIYQAGKVNSSPPVIDGMLNEEIWNIVDWSGDFVMREPYEGIKPTQKTAFKIIYDDQNLYVAIKAYDSVPGEIEKRLSRRDEFDGDWVGIAIDSYYDKLTAFSFNVSAAGVKNDLVVTNEDQSDDTWDPVWYVKTAIVDDGWNAEMKIPLTQLRFAKKQEHVWGLQVMRWLFRKEEFITWQHIPLETSRWVSGYGELHGISGIDPKREVELIPYVMGNTERYPVEEGNPFSTGKDFGFSAGLDGKIAVTNDLTMNFTVNPDFGQVEADPSVVNLTAFETFFPEKRPFFIEGNNIFSFPVTNGDGDLSLDNLFYSRRIGRRPRHEPELEENEYMDSPEFTRILGAFKLSGKTKNGLSVGVMESVTNRDFATIDKEGEKREELIEPLTNYFNTRLQQDFNKGKRIFGGMFTATHRKIEDPVDFLHHSAYTGGLDFTNYWKNRSYYFKANTVFSHMAGNSKSILELQQASQRYFQRTDATHLKIDSARTTLTGNGGSIEGGKIGTGHWRYIGWLTWRTPGLELNDMGFLRQADIIQQLVWVQYKIWEPFSIFRNFNFNINQWSNWDFAGTRLNLGGNLNLNAQFKNFWFIGTGIERTSTALNRSELRGGPALKYPGDWNHWISLESDERKRLVAELSLFNNWGGQKSSRFFDIGLEIAYRPWNALSLSLEPSYRKGKRVMQYVETIELENENRYIIATLNSEMFGTDFRINFNITPDLTIQYWGQPYLFAGNYTEFKRVTNPASENYQDRYHVFGEDEIFYNSEENTYQVDEDRDGVIDYTIDNPNFNFFEFRSNMVVRWEYIPGSTFYFVWSQGRTDDNNVGEFDFRNDMEELFSIEPHNIFLIKLSYRISL